MQTYLCKLPGKHSLHIEAEPLYRLLIYLSDQSSVDELQQFAQCHGIVWTDQGSGLHYLRLPSGTLQQRIAKRRSPLEETYLIHLPGGGALEHRRVLHPNIEPGHPWANAWKVSIISLFRPLD
jgi:hypothetical protein